MSRNKKIIVKIIFVLLLAAAVIYTFQNNVKEIGIQLQQTKVQVLGGIMGLSIVYHLLEGLITFHLARLNMPHFTYRQGVECAFYCSFYRVSTLGSGTGAAGVFYLERKGCEVSYGAGMCMIQYVWHKISIAVFSGIFILFNYSFVQSNFSSYRWIIVTGYLMTIFICLILTLSLCSVKFHRILIAVMQKFSYKSRFIKDKMEMVGEKFNLLEEGALSLVKNKKLMLSVILINQIKLFCWYVIPYVVLKNCGASETGIPEAVTITALAVMLAAMIPSPAGIGSVEFMMMTLFGVTAGAGSAGTAAILYRMATFVFPFLAGMIPAVKMGFGKRQDVDFHIVKSEKRGYNKKSMK